jgi:hypothetical protein
MDGFDECLRMIHRRIQELFDYEINYKVCDLDKKTRVSIRDIYDLKDVKIEMYINPTN